jgi:NAD(P)H-quinone oxidoreductase subunit 5
MIRTARLVQFSLCIVLLIAISLGTWNGISGDQSFQLARFHGSASWLSLGIRIDGLSSLLFLMIAILAFTIGQYSKRYLDGEPRQGYFYRNLLFTVLSVSLLVLSSNLVMFFGLWLTTSLGLHQLLVYYPERPLAVAAARKKFVVSRIGDIALLLAIVLTYRVFGTVEFTELFEMAQNPTFLSGQSASLSTIGFLFALGAMTKSAQFPFHFWLPETMETPTPVSALMHAGIINAGGFLLIRLSPLLQYAESAHFVLAIVGSVSAVFGALAMMTQNDIKKKLAYSTISQMGMMIFCCGIGAFSLALFHLIAHSFYKAHAFLSTGALVEESRKNEFGQARYSRAWLAFIGISGAILIIAGTELLGPKAIAYLTYGSILLLGIAQNAQFSFRKDSVGVFGFFGQIVSVFVVAGVACVSIEFGLHRSLTDLFPITWDSVIGLRAACLISYSIFFGGLWLSLRLTEPTSRRLRHIYAFFWNGGYFSTRTKWISDGRNVKA